VRELEQGRGGGPVRLGNVLNRILTMPSPSEEELHWVCEKHGPVPPVELKQFDAQGNVVRVLRRIRGRCRACMAEEEAERRAREAELEKERRLRRYAAAFPVAEMGRLQFCTLDDFEARDGAVTALEAARAFARGLPAPDPPGLLVWGQPGNGKSHLAAALANLARRMELAVAWVHAPSWLTYLGTLEADERDDLLQRAATADLLVLDDLAGGRLTAPRVGWLQDLVDARYRRWAPTVVTTNLSPGQLRTVLNRVALGEEGLEDVTGDGDRIVDRLAELCVIVHNTATSYRLGVAQRRREDGDASG